LENYSLLGLLACVAVVLAVCLAGAVRPDHVPYSPVPADEPGLSSLLPGGLVRKVPVEPGERLVPRDCKEFRLRPDMPLFFP
jgi:hypothetical protein